MQQFVVFRLNTVKRLGQCAPLYIAAISMAASGSLLGTILPRCCDATHRQPAAHPVEHGAARRFLLPTVLQKPDDEYLTVWRLLPTVTTRSISAHPNAFNSAALLHELPPLLLIITQQFFTGLHVWVHLVVQCCTKTALFDDHWRHLAACYLPKVQLLSTLFTNAPCVWNIPHTMDNLQLNIVVTVWHFLSLSLVYVKDYWILL